MRCPECGEHFEPLAVNQVFCSRGCGSRWRRRRGAYNSFPPVEFTCAQCGRTVVTEGGCGDKRTRFCCRECEKKYWRHPPHENEPSRINFSSLEAYIRHEKGTDGQA